MFTVIDSARPLTALAPALARAGIRAAVRYYNHRDVSIPGKRLTAAEARALAAAGLSLAVVFQQRAGAGEPHGHIEDFSAEAGRRDAGRALALAAEIGQPEGSAIYFAVDWDFIRASELDAIAAYFRAAKARLGGAFRTGVYGSGRICDRLLGAGLAELAWLAQAKGWSGYAAFLQSQKWALAQGPSTIWPQSDLRYDPNHTNPAFPDFGQFTLTATPAAAPGAPEAANGHPSPAPGFARSILRVTARDGLEVRGGPGLDFARLRTFPPDTLVFGLARQGDWIRIDAQGDGRTDGYMHSGYLELMAGGFPLPHPPGATPYDIARRELAEDIREFPGAATNPRIFLYHASTGHGDPDAVPWCSSFVNYCVEAAGLAGTGSKSARSWHEQGWGADVTGDPREGDIAVWERRWTDARGQPQSGGHVAFMVSAGPDSLVVLGGNQSNRVSIQTYPRAGTLGGQTYALRSIRRAQG